MNKITPFLWFDNNAQEASEFYTSIFKNSKITFTSPMMVSFNLDGQEFMALNGGPEYKFNEAYSMFVNCEDQIEIDYYWDKLVGNGGSEGRCGWCKDKYGLSWQIVPKNLGELIQTKEGMDAMLKMNKIVISELENSSH